MPNPGFPLTVLVTVLFAGAASAQNTEQLPPPKQTIPAPFVLQPAPPPPLPFTRLLEPPPPLDSRNGWMYFAPNSMGHLRPRVVLSPYQPFYLYNGRPYYGLQTRFPYILPVTSD